MQQIMHIKDIASVTQYLEPKLITYLQEGQIETFESFEDFDIIAFDWYDIYHLDQQPEQILIYIDREDLFFFCEAQISLEKVKSIFKQDSSNERALYLFFREMFRSDSKYLEDLEDQMNLFEDQVITGNIHNAAERIVVFRSQLMQLKKYYDQLDDIFEELSDNDNGLISDHLVSYCVILGKRTSRFVASVNNLREYVTQVREAYQAQIDIEQNNLMKIFTIVTSIFLPLTLLVGWYGMNFERMPELSWEYGYVTVIIASIVICVVMVIIFKRKKWF